MSVASFGGFSLNSPPYYLLERPYDMVQFKEATFPIARMEGAKTTSAQVNERTIAIKLKITGTSRSNLESNIQSLYAALAPRQQSLILDAFDNRFMIADCLEVKTQLAGNVPLVATAQITFLAQVPWPVAPSSSTFDTGNVLLTASGGNYVFPTQTFAGGGSIYSRPQIRVYQNTLANNTTLTSGLTSGNNYTSLSVAALPQNVAIGDTFILTSGAHTQSVVASATALAGGTSIIVTSFNANFSYPASTTTCNKDLTWSMLQIQQQTDNQLVQLSFASIVSANGDYIDFFTDPYQALTGATIQKNASGVPLAFNGMLYLTQEPYNTNWLVTITANSPPTARAVWTWTARWLA